MFILYGKILKLSTTFVLFIFPDSAPNSVSVDFCYHCWCKIDSVQLLKKNWVKFCRWSYIEFCCCLCWMDEMLTHFSFFDRWTTTPTPLLVLTCGSVVMGCTVPASPPCCETCCTVSALRGPPRTVSSIVGVVRSTWTSRLNPQTRAWRLGLRQPREMTSVTPWRGPPTGLSQSSMSATCQTPPVPSLPCSPSVT
jgi:hypothetical protein